MIAEETNHPHGLQQNMENAHKNFLKEAIPFLYEFGREKQAQQWFNYLKTIYTNAFVGKEASISMEDYAVSQIATDINETDMNKIQASILGMFDWEFICLIRDNDSQAANYENMAKKIWAYYDQKTKGSAPERVGLKPIAQLQQFELKKVLDRLPPQARAILLSKLPQAPPPAAAPGPAAAAGP